MRTIYLDSDYKCHVTDDGTMISAETDFFDGKSDEFVERHRFVPEGYSWTRSDGIVFYGEMIAPLVQTSEEPELEPEFVPTLFFAVGNSEDGYNPQSFEDGETLYAHHLNTIEDGIVELEKKVDSIGTGSDGEDGFSPSVTVEQTDTGAVISITDKSGTTTATITNGEKGDPGSDANVTAENIERALGYKPADDEDVSVLLDALDTVETVIPSINLNDGVYEYGRFASAGTEYDKDTPIETAFRNANYIPVQGGRTMAIYYDAYEWNNNNKGRGAYLVEYDADKNIIGTRRTITTYTADQSGFTLDASTAYIRLCSYSNSAAITTPLDEIKIALYYIEDAQMSFVPYDPTIIEEKVFNPEAVSVLRGKKIVYDGDSICESRTTGTEANGGGYAKIIADLTKSTAVNLAVGGARLCASSERHSVVNNLANLPADGDLYCFEGGINDFWGNTPIGECSLTDYTVAVDSSTICGALETIFRYCLTNFLGKPVCFVITHKIQNTAASENTNGDTFRDYRDAMVKVCQKYSIPYYDAFTESGLNGWNTAQSNAYLTANSSGTGDGCHPNAEGYRRYYVPQLLALFKKIYPNEV